MTRPRLLARCHPERPHVAWAHKNGDPRIVLAGVDLVRSRGQALTSWAVVLVCIGLLWGLLR